MMLRTAIAGALAALALSGTAVAQPAPIPPPQPDAARMALAQQIYDMIGAGTLDATTKAMHSMMSTMAQSAGGADTARQQAMQAALGDSIDKMMPRVLHGTVEIMAQDFTVDELRGMLAFYQSPTGQAVLQKMPVITQQSMRLSLSEVPQMMRDFQTDYCHRVTCTDKEHEAFAQMNARFAQLSSPPPSSGAR
jgi:hypothetical protein